MNRLKVWLYALVVVGGAYAAVRLHVQELRAAALSELDARLAAASAQLLAATRSLTREASASAALAARDPRLLEALRPAAPAAPAAPAGGKRGRAPAPPPVDPEAEATAVREAARAALGSVERTFGFDLPEGTVVLAAGRDGLARQAKARGAEGEAATLLAAAVAGKPHRGWVRVNGALFYAAAAPAGEGAGVVVLTPLDDARVRALAGATGALVTLSVPEVKPLSSAGPDAKAFAGWNRGAGVPTDVGRLDGAPFALGPLRLASLPLPFGASPAFRARAVQLEALKGGFVVAAVPTAAALGGVARLHWLAVLVLAVVLLVGVVVGFLVRSHEAPAALPEELLAAAGRIERGDFAARVPPLAGKFGTLGAALNKAAELAGPAAAAESVVASAARELPLPPRPAPPERLAPITTPREELISPPAPAAEPPPPPPAPAPAPAPTAADEDGHFRQVFQDFLRTRASCGEPSEGLTFEKFRVKLDGNKTALVAKYGCKTVRFQVYVKDGKAALKATPVR